MYVAIFISAFLLNLVWENLHAQLYTHYKGGPITRRILTRATFWDAVIITVTFMLWNEFYLPRLLLPVALFIFAILMEMWALRTGRWAYKKSMPVIPYIGAGWSPAVQLALTAEVVALMF